MEGYFYDERVYLFWVEDIENVGIVGYGVIFSMNCEDYIDFNGGYVIFEKRYIFVIKGSKDIIVVGFKLYNLGGDGILVGIGVSYDYCENIYIYDCIIDQYYC